MTQQVSKPPEQIELPPDISQPLPGQHRRFSKAGIYILLGLIGLLIVSSTSLLLLSLAQGLTYPAAGTATLTPTQQPSRAQTVVPTATTDQIAIPTPITDIFGGTPQQIATLDPNQVITSMALSSDGTTIAWSTEPAGGDGLIDIYAGPLTAPTRVFEQSSSTCPCFRIFAFMNGQGKQGNTTLLLTDGQQSHEAIQFGLWALNITNPATPQPLMDEENSQQGPLALAPHSNILLYSSYEGQVPMPSDNSVPDDVATLTYPNSLDMTTLDGQPLAMDTSRVLLPEQHYLSNRAVYHWVTTPVFTLDGHTLLYVEFSSQSQAPYDRSSALFEVQVSGLGKHLHVSKPQLIVGSTARLLELGPWFNNHILTFYGDGTLYALDIQSGAVETIAQTKAYARIIAVVGLGSV